MKKSIKLLILMLLLGSSTLSAQRIISFTYDNAGNRETRKETIITLAPKTTVDTTVVGDTDIDEEELSKIEEEHDFERLEEGQIKVFPNPVKGALMVRLENISSTEGIHLQLYNSTGSLLQTKKLGSNYSQFDMHAYSPGVYILLVVRQDEIVEYKIIKQ